MNRFGFTLGLFLSLFQLSSGHAMEGSPTSNVTTYTIEQSSDDQNILIIRLTPVPSQGGSFILGCKSFIQPQIENLTCDGKIIKEESEGSWVIPEGVHDLHWQVRLKDAKETEVAAQQSVKSDSSIILSVGSSIPRFKNVNGLEVVKISMPTIRTTYPEPGPSQTIPLPDPSKPPFFILLNFINCGSKTEGSITLTYLVDDQKSEFLLPDMEANLKGLKWLKEVTDVNDQESFTVGWCKSDAEKLGISGVAGSGVLLAHYLPSKKSLADKALMLYVALHEAFHQFQTHFPDEPGWVQESLASYYGSRAMEIAMPEEAPALINLFKDAALKFPKGLLTIHSEVKGGDHSNYGAFYTKGVAFWAAVDNALRSEGDTLDAHLQDILSKMKYDKDGAPMNLDTLLGLSQNTWASLREQFLLDQSKHKL